MVSECRQDDRYEEDDRDVGSNDNPRLIAIPPPNKVGSER
jgi:hypothetical protein